MASPTKGKQAAPSHACARRCYFPPCRSPAAAADRLRSGADRGTADSRQRCSHAATADALNITAGSAAGNAIGQANAIKPMPRGVVKQQLVD